MTMRDLIPWGRRGQNPGRPHEDTDPFMTLHREMNRLFDDVFRGFGTGGPGTGFGTMAWPQMEVVENERDIRVCVELPGMDERDVEVLMSDGLLTVRGEKKAETDDREHAFSERIYGRFERRIPLPRDVEEERVDASFRNGVLTVTLPRAAGAAAVRRIPLNRGQQNPQDNPQDAPHDAAKH